MAHSLSAKKRIRQNVAAAARNSWRMRNLRGALKVLEDKLVHAEYSECQTAFQKACQLLDKSASKGVIHKNTAARRKSRLSARVKAKKK